VECRGVRDAVH